jgi:hypothetical protein
MISYEKSGTAPDSCLDGNLISRTTIGDKTSYTVTNLKAATLYSFRICALNSLSPADFSSGKIVGGATPPPPGFLPNNLTPFAITSEKIAPSSMPTITWTQSAEDARDEG